MLLFHRYFAILTGEKGGVQVKRLLFALIAVLFLGGCAPKEQMTQKTVFAMDTVMDLQIWGEDAAAAAKMLEQKLLEMDKSWSATEEDSVPGTLNRGEKISDPEHMAFLQKAQELSERTEGAFDPKLHELISLWGFLSDEHYVPTQAEIDAAKAIKLWNLGAVVKGYAGQEMAELLKEFDVQRAILNLGGNIQTYGEKPDGNPWKIGIQNPDGGDPIGTVSVTGTMSIVTSGDYQRYFDKDGVRYHHILDPKTGRPAESGLSSVTVICRDGAAADALSTALFVMGLEQGTEHWRQSDDFEAVFLLKSGQIYATEGAALSGCEYEVIRR